MSDGMLAGALGQIGQGVQTGINSLFSLYQNSYDRWQQGVTWNREDTAVQRRVADLRAAGLSPTLAAGSAAQTSQPFRASTPKVEGLSDYAANMLGMLRQKAEITQTEEQTKLTKLMQQRQKIENKYLDPLRQAKLDSMNIANDFANQSLADRLQTVSEKLSNVQKKNLELDLKNELKKYEAQLRLPVVAEWITRNIERGLEITLKGQHIAETDKRILYMQAMIDYLKSGKEGRDYDTRAKQRQEQKEAQKGERGWFVDEVIDRFIPRLGK